MSFNAPKFLILMKSYVSIFFLWLSVLLVSKRRSPCLIQCPPPIFSSKSFILLGLMFRSLKHFELIFVCGVR